MSTTPAPRTPPVKVREAQASPNAKTPPSSSRFSSKSPRAGSGSFSSPGGTTLMVDGMSTSRSRQQGSAAFRSTSSIGDAHIKALSSQINKVPFKDPPMDQKAKRSTVVAFGATGSNERNSHYRELLKRTGGNTQGGLKSWGSPGGQASACYRSKSPIACAHINAVSRPWDPSYSPNTQRSPSRELPSASYRSNSSIADAHIKALNKPMENTQGMHDISKGIHSPVQASFRSKGSIADAHIKAVPKPADVCVAYREQPF